MRVLGLLQQQRVDIFSLVQKFFPYKNPDDCILRNPFLVRVFLNVGHKIFPYIPMRGGQVMSDPSVLCIPFNLMSLAFYLRSKLTPSTWSRRLQIYISGYKADGFVWNIALCFYISGYIYNFILIVLLIMFTLKKII